MDQVAEATPGLLEQITTWCEAHPSIRRHRSYEPLTLHRYADGSIGIEGKPPDVIALSVPLLNDAHLRYVTFAEGVLTIDIGGDALRYQALGRAEFDFAMVFERIKDGP